MTIRQKPKSQVPAVPGWFTMENETPALTGSRCTSCGTFYFPSESFLCKNPACSGREFEETPLSTRGRIWSYTDARYQPPPPFVASDPYEAFAICAVELEREQMVVMGQVASGYAVTDLAVGDEVELVVESLYSDEDNDYMVWKWKPLHGAGTR